MKQNISEFKKLKMALSNLTENLENSLNIENVPEIFKEKIKELQKEVDLFDLKKYKEKPKLLTGEVISENEFLEIVKDISGYTKWKIDIDIDKDYEEGYDEVESTKEMFEVDFDSSISKSYKIVRDSKSRDDLWLIGVVSVPGHFYIRLDTGRVGWDLDGMLTLNEVKKELEKIFD